MNKKISIGTAIAIAILFATITFAITMVYAMNQFNDKVYSIQERERMYSKVAEIDSIVRQHYINAIPEGTLTDATADGFVVGIGDKNARYFNAATYARMQADYSGKTVQIGIVPAKDESGYILVNEVYPESPAQAAAIEPGDLIIRIDELDITAENYNEAVTALTGEPGTKMTIVVRRDVEDNTLEMTRRFVEVPSVSSSMLEQNVGYLKIKEFNDNTPEQFSKQVNRLIDEGAAGLIFDVRGVTSGTLRSVAQVLDKLLPEGTLVSSTGKNGVTTVLETSDAREVALPMAVLANEKTSGEAELFAQVIKDYGKGKVVGMRTAGRGTMQTTYPLSDGSAVRLTTARYSPPSGTPYDQEGVKPDYEVKMTEEQIALAQSLGGIENDPQMKKAHELAVAAIKAVSDGQVATSESGDASLSASEAASSVASSSNDSGASALSSSEIAASDEASPASSAR